MTRRLRRPALVLALTALLIGVVAAPAGADKPVKTAETDRPVTDWYRDKRDPIGNGLQANGQNAYLVNDWNFDVPGYWFAGGFAPYGCGMTDEAVKSVKGKTKFEGTIKERPLPGGLAEVTVDIHVTNSPLTVFRNEEMFGWLDACFGPAPEIPLPDPIVGAGDNGSIDYDLELVMTIPEPGAVIVNWLSVVNGFVPPPYHVSYLKIDGEGTGTFTDAAAGGWDGFTPGDTAEVKLHVEHGDEVPFNIVLEVKAED